CREDRRPPPRLVRTLLRLSSGLVAGAPLEDRVGQLVVEDLVARLRRPGRRVDRLDDPALRELLVDDSDAVLVQPGVYLREVGRELGDLLPRRQNEVLEDPRGHV